MFKLIEVVCWEDFVGVIGKDLDVDVVMDSLLVFVMLLVSIILVFEILGNRECDKEFKLCILLVLNFNLGVVGNDVVIFLDMIIVLLLIFL